MMPVDCRILSPWMASSKLEEAMDLVRCVSNRPEGWKKRLDSSRGNLRDVLSVNAVETHPFDFAIAHV